MSITESVSSNCLAIDSLPEPENLRANFFYKEYSADETLAASGDLEIVLNFTHQELLLGRPVIVSESDFQPEFLQVVHTAADLTVSKSSQVAIRDDGILKRTFQSLERSCKLRGVSGNATDKALKLSKQLAAESSNVNIDTLQKVAVNYNAQALYYFSINRVVDSGKLGEGIPVSGLISDKIVYDSLKLAEKRAINSNSLGLLANEAALAKQNEERANGAKLNVLETESVLIPASLLPRGTANLQDITRVAIQILRTEIFTSGQTEITSKLLKADATTYTDTDIRYGSKYTYCAKSIYEINLKDFIPIGDFSTFPIEISAFVASVPSNLATVTTVERVPPPYPVDVSFRFDYQRGELAVRWEFPVNRVQDITRFQVFRRSSSTEPFLLLKELDFDKSEFKVPRPDAPLPVNVSVSDQPVRSYVDRDFGRSSKYIYAVAAVDAHGYASNYSAQYEVSFDTRLRGLRVRSVSPAGAPRPYPNIYFDTQQPLIDDTITRGKVSSVNFVFDPEYLRVEDRAGNDLNLIRYSGEAAKYYLNVIDTNRAEQISIPIEIVYARSLGVSLREAAASSRSRRITARSAVYTERVS